MFWFCKSLNDHKDSLCFECSWKTLNHDSIKNCFSSKFEKSSTIFQIAELRLIVKLFVRFFWENFLFKFFKIVFLFSNMFITISNIFMIFSELNFVPALKFSRRNISKMCWLVAKALVASFKHFHYRQHKYTIVLFYGISPEKKKTRWQK